MNAKNLIKILEACAVNTGVQLEDLIVQVDDMAGYTCDIEHYFMPVYKDNVVILQAGVE